MYRITLYTSAADRFKVKDWNTALYLDIISALNNFTWICGDIKDVKRRIENLLGWCGDNIDLTEYFELENQLYGKRTEKTALPGICSGYVDIEKELNKLLTWKEKKISFELDSFYDSRALRGPLKECLHDSYLYVVDEGDCFDCILQEHKMVLWSNDNVSLPVIFKNLCGVNFDSKKDYEEYIKGRDIKKGEIVAYIKGKRYNGIVK